MKSCADITFDTAQRAILMLASVRAALSNGVRHYDMDGNLLDTERKIFDALSKDQQIRFDVSNRVQNVSEIELFYSLGGNRKWLESIGDDRAPRP